MRPTHRSWGAGGLVVALTALAVVLDRPILLAGTALVGGWLLGRQWTFTRDRTRTNRSLSVRQSPAETALRTDESTPVTLTATLDTPLPVSIDVEAGVPTGAAATEPLNVRLDPGATSVTRTVDVAWPVTGRHRFDRATVTVTDGFFERTLSIAERPTVTVEPRGPREIHVGRGGERIATMYGEHEIEGIGSGIEPAEIREYVPGDRADRIDWKATARLGSPHVREYETQATRRTLVVVDHRRTLTTGPPHETKLDYLRQVALAIVERARGLGDPVGLLTVGDGGVTDRIQPASTPRHYASVRRRLLELEPTIDDESSGMASASSASMVATGASANGEANEYAPSDSWRRSTNDTTNSHRTVTGDGASTQKSATSDTRPTHAELEGDDALSAAVRPFYADRQAYRTRIEDDPLFGGVRMAVASKRDERWTILLTDDTRPMEVRETVALARSNGTDVTVALAPTVLYEPGGLADVERAYDRYASFEAWRRELAGTDHVTALEVGPGDRLSAILSAGGAHRGGNR